MSLTDEPTPLPRTHPTGERRAEAERIRNVLWPPDESPEARQARIARNLEALRSLPKWNIDPKVLEEILEDPDNEYYGS
jgi:hypothetical protein